MKTRFVLPAADSFMVLMRYVKHVMSIMLLIVTIILPVEPVKGEDLLGVYMLALENDSIFQKNVSVCSLAIEYEPLAASCVTVRSGTRIALNFITCRCSMYEMNMSARLSSTR